MSNNFERTQTIIEDLRADIDFELDDVLVKIVNGLPEAYFRSFSNVDLLKPLKALLALGICQLDDEIMLRSDDGNQITVVANRNYPGQLANILKRLPDQSPLLGARVFTSKDHDFIIDLFEYKNKSSDQPAASDSDLEQLIEDVAGILGKSADTVSEFVGHYDRHNRILRYPEQVVEQFLAFNDIEHSKDAVVRFSNVPDSKMIQLTVSLGCSTAKQVFQQSAEFLGQRDMDIERAWMHDIFPLGGNVHAAIASFLVDDSALSNFDFDVAADQLKQRLSDQLATG